MSFLSFSDSPIISSSVFPTEPYWSTPSFGTVFKDFHGLASRLRGWSSDPIAYFTYVTSPLKDDLGLQDLVNVTSLTVDEAEIETEQAVQGVAEAETGQIHESEVETEQVIKENGSEEEVSGVVKEVDAEYGAGEKEMEILGENTEIMEDSGIEESSFAVYQSAVPEVVKEVDAEYSTRGMEMEILDNTETVEDKNMEAEMVVFENANEDGHGTLRIEMDTSEDMIDMDPVGYKLEKEVVVDEKSNGLGQEAVEPKEIAGGEEDGSDVNSFDHMESDISVDEEEILHGHEEIKWMNYGTMLGLSLASLVVFATLVFFLHKKQRQGPVIEKEKKKAKKVGAVSYCNHQNLRGGEGAIGDSVSSEVSYSWNNTSISGQRQTRGYKEEDNMSDERKLRRDSSVSSSISYGSFTTYERLSAKKGGRDEEVATPVRRSSRIRSLTSP